MNCSTTNCCRRGKSWSCCRPGNSCSTSREQVLSADVSVSEGYLNRAIAELPRLKPEIRQVTRLQLSRGLTVLAGLANYFEQGEEIVDDADIAAHIASGSGSLGSVEIRRGFAACRE